MVVHDTEDEERAVERQLELHLEEQKESLFTVKEALSSDPSNTELIAVHEELQIAIKDAEGGLLHLKRSRLLKEADFVFAGEDLCSVDKGVKVEPLDLKPSMSEHSSETYPVGSKCRFRHSDGRWYNGLIVSIEGATTARISFLTPTSENMLMCKFFLQRRCHFGNNCRMSHGFCVSFSSLRPYTHTEWHQSLVGSSIWALSGSHSNIWRRAELEFWDNDLCLGQVIFQDDGSSAKLGSDALSISEHARASSDTDDDEDEMLSTESSSSSGEENATESVHQGLGFLNASVSLKGVQTETAIFAKWEHHTRGIASKMMTNMGFQKGMGLGISGQGMVDPIPVKVLPLRKSLDHVFALDHSEKNNAGRRKKRSRGGRRKQEKKIAEAARLAKAEEDDEIDVFNFINYQLGGQTASDLKGNKLKGGFRESEGKVKVEDRRSLVAYEDEIMELRNRIEKLEDMMNRNRKDKAMFEAVSRKLTETRKALTDAETARASASNAVMSKEKEKRWLKF